MTGSDIEYIKKVLAAGLIQSPCLELGVGYEEGLINKQLLVDAGIDYVGTDMISGPAVDYVVDFEKDWSHVEQNLPGAGNFRSALVLNILEHTFEPVKVLDNVFKLLGEGGICIVVTPAVWPLHSYPYDCCRLLPNFYEEYCQRRSLHLLKDHFEYVGKGPVRSYRAGKEYAFPRPGTAPQRLRSRLIQKLFNTTGRHMFFPSHIAIGAVIQK